MKKQLLCGALSLMLVFSSLLGFSACSDNSELLDRIDKNSLFPAIMAGGVLPRKTFSMGEADEKRFYLEARWIKEKEAD